MFHAFNSVTQMNPAMPPWWQAVTAEFVYEQDQQVQPSMNQCSPYEKYDENIQCVSSNVNADGSIVNDNMIYSPFSDQSDLQSNVSDEYRSYLGIPAYAPCQGPPQPWNYGYCYGYYGEPACPLMNMVDMEDFM